MYNLDASRLDGRGRLSKVDSEDTQYEEVLRRRKFCYNLAWE